MSQTESAASHVEAALAGLDKSAGEFDPVIQSSDFTETEAALMKEIEKLSLAEVEADERARKMLDESRAEFDTIAEIEAEIQTNYLVSLTNAQNNSRQFTLDKFIDDILVSLEDFSSEDSSDSDDSVQDE